MEVRDMGGMQGFMGSVLVLTGSVREAVCRKCQDLDYRNRRWGHTCQEIHSITWEQMEGRVRRMRALGTNLETSRGPEASLVPFHTI